MSTDVTPEERAAGEICEHELKRLCNDWWCFLVLGILLVVGGTAAIVYPCYTSVGIIIFFGAVLMVSGIATVISAFWAGKWSGFFVQVLVGLLYAVAGYVITDTPVESTALMTLMLAGFFVVAGGFRIVTALMDKYPQWGWALLNGVITLLLGLVVFRSFRAFPDEPDKIFWIIGLLVGLELLFNGWTWIMLSLALKRLAAAAEDDA
jgi:uncharacterized membrane protein HdeD (DUF308 family)